jgi:ferredoxin
LPLKISVDKDICQGNAVCVMRSADVFALSEDELAQVLVDSVPDERRGELFQTAASCPTQAIRVTEMP